MPGTNLTRDEARERARLLDVHGYEIALDLAADGDTFASTTTIRFSCAQPGASTFADLVAPRVREVELNGRVLDPATVFTDSRIALHDLAPDNELRVVADCAYMRTGEGLHRFRDPADGETYLYTQFEVPDARRVFTTFEQPDLKSTFTLGVTAPDAWTVVSNASTPEPEPAGAGRARWRFAATPRMSTYLVALVAGPYVAVRDTYAGQGGEVPLGLFARRSLADHLDAEDLFTVTKQGFAFYEEQFGVPYPFGKYDQLFVPEYNMGAMENVGAVTYRDDYLFRSRQVASAYEGRANTVLHEMAHMWFGDLVTMRWWDDLWLNESFAEWASHWSSVNATRYTEAWVNFAARKNWAYRADQLPSTHPVAADMTDLETVEGNFDGITYAKGASALRQLVAWVGEKEFVAGLRTYFAQHAWGNATFADLIGALEDSSGRDLSDWARLWLQTTGVNTLSVRADTDADGRYTSFAIAQTASGEHPTLRPHRMAVGIFDDRDGRLVRRGRVELDVTGALTDVPEMVGQPEPDLLLLNDDDLTFAKVRLDQRSLATLVDSIDGLDEPLARSLCWTSAWDMTRDAELAASRFVDMVLRGLPSEDEIAAVQHLTRQAASAIDSFVAAEHRDDVRSRWTAGLRALLTDAAPGSDVQLQLVRALAASAVTTEDLDLVRGLYDGSTPLPELTVDTDLRWTLLIALARRGHADDAAIDAELSRDATITGQEHAATARAARPDPAAKARAWTDAVERDDVANQTQLATIGGFAQSGQQDLLAPYVERYFAVADDIWERRIVKMASNVLVGMFPRLLADDGLVARAGQWLDATRATPAARRIVAEGRADAARAVAAQAYDHAHGG